MLFFILGKSGSGKDTIVREILKQFDIDANSRKLSDEDKKYMLKQVVYYTTRPMRAGEQEGVEYHFVSNMQRLKMKMKKQILEERVYKTVNGKWYYFTANDEQLKSMSDLIMVGPLKQYEELNKKLGVPIIPIYIKICNNTIKKRLMGRESLQENPNYKELERRFEADNKDFEDIYKLPGLVEIDNNGSLSSAVLQLTNIIHNLMDSYYMLKAEVLGVRAVDSQTVTEFTDEEQETNKDG